MHYAGILRIYKRWAMDNEKIEKVLAFLRKNGIEHTHYTHPEAPTIEIARKYKNVYFFEESVEFGSIAEHFGNMLSKAGFDGKYEIHCVSGFVPHMSVESAMKIHGLDRNSIKNAVEEALK